MGVPCGSGNFSHFHNSGRSHQSLETSEGSLDGRPVSVIPAVRGDTFACDDDGASSSSKPSSRRRDRKSTWKPYCQLTWQEKEWEEKERIRAERRRSQLVCPAPHNVSQFLMADQQESESTEEEDGNYVALDRGYAEEWAKVLSENLEKLSKDHLKVHAVEVEREVAELRRRLRILEHQKDTGRT
ncbi:hypothetical protein RvY_19100 [Ramazzottius varieornatus]|uniref:Uncharacterized protein n=1 Tax=Ramazzottius varieornatus TaxID=947166 RepID=A0A1D1WBK6_RAMVA|nr:hypothetical protein RvY_19100 [Ramazzottius varieornatus]